MRKLAVLSLLSAMSLAFYPIYLGIGWHNLDINAEIFRGIRATATPVPITQWFTADYLAFTMVWIVIPCVAVIGFLIAIIGLIRNIKWAARVLLISAMLAILSAIAELLGTAISGRVDLSLIALRLPSIFITVIILWKLKRYSRGNSGDSH